MKLNNIDDCNDKDYEEINNIYKLIMIKYRDDFDEEKARYFADLLYVNGIRSYMFFDKKFDVDEIVYYLLDRDKIRKFPDKREYCFDSVEDNNDIDIGEIIKFNKYFRKNNRK